jgi:hypothetical protein
VLPAGGRASGIMLTGTRAAVVGSAASGSTAGPIVIGLAGGGVVTASAGVYGSVSTVGRVGGSSAPRSLIGASRVVVAVSGVAAITRR